MGLHFIGQKPIKAKHNHTMLRLVSIFVAVSRCLVSGEPSAVSLGEGTCGGGEEFTRETRCVAATSDADLENFCRNQCLGETTDETPVADRCRGFAFIATELITNDFSGCRERGFGRCDLFFGCTEISTTKSVNDPMERFIIEGMPECTTTSTTPRAIVYVNEDGEETETNIVWGSDGPTIPVGWSIIGVSVAVFCVAIIVVIAICCCFCCDPDK